MPVIQVITPELYRDPDEIAGTRRRTPGEGGGAVPTGLAGYTYDGAAYCPECAAGVEAESATDGETYTLDRFPPSEHDPNGFGVGVVSCTDEWDYPGASCHVCHRTLNTNVLVYDEGGAHPPVRTALIDGVNPTRVGVLERDAEDARVILLEPADESGSYGGAGSISWVPVYILEDE